MQLARLLEPKKRTYTNKLAEMMRAVQFELHYSKDELLEMYLSLLPYSSNIEGVKSASYLYFNSPPNKLSLAQAITLAIIPNNPNKYRIDKNAEVIIAKRNKWIRKFSYQNFFGKI
jgi:penicillin-binding protein 1C